MRQFYLSVIGGQRRGVGATLLRGFLSLMTLVYGALHGTRRLFYRIGVFRSTRFPCPVVSVGNLTAGGTGKTPLVEFLSRWFARRNFRIAILARGYGRIEERGTDDEDVATEMALDHVVRLAGKDRVANGKRAIGEHRADLLLLDDGFQHYRIQRNLDIVTVDATQPFANGHLLPRGLLRERPSALRRADLVVLTRTDQVPVEELEALRARIGPAVETVHRPVHVRSLWNRKQYGLEWLRGRSVYAFCGVGNPEAFRKTLEGLGTPLVKFRAFQDHHVFTPQDLRRINAEAQEFMAEVIVTTEKDATRVHAEGFELPLAALRVEIEIVRHEELLEERLLGVIRDLPRAAAAPIGK